MGGAERVIQIEVIVYSRGFRSYPRVYLLQTKKQKKEWPFCREGCKRNTQRGDGPHGTNQSKETTNMLAASVKHISRIVHKQMQYLRNSSRKQRCPQPRAMVQGHSNQRNQREVNRAGNAQLIRTRILRDSNLEKTIYTAE